LVMASLFPDRAPGIIDERRRRLLACLGWCPLPIRYCGRRLAGREGRAGGRRANGDRPRPMGRQMDDG
jgi:hypothetical protein